MLLRSRNGGSLVQARRYQRTDADPLSPAALRRIRSVLAFGGVPFDDLDDGVQQVQLRFIERQNSGETLDDPVAWAVVVASRLALDWHRMQGRGQGLRERLQARWAESGGPARIEEDVVLGITIAAGIDSLSPIQRQVLILRFFQDMQVRDIAKALEVPEGTIKSRLNGAVTAMRGYLRAEGLISDG